MHQAKSIFALLVMLTACSGGEITNTPDAGSNVGDAMASDSGLGGCNCNDDEICVDNACQPLPSTCPCPMESYCDIAQNTCVRGCLDDAYCDTGRICGDNRTCAEGCREDEQCTTPGNICEGELCQIGCRTDEQCTTAGQICESLSCRAGCRAANDCTVPGQLCHLSISTCGTCNDPDEEDDTTVSTRGRGEIASVTVTRMLCNDPTSPDADADVINWRPSFDGDGFVWRTELLARLTVTGMEPDSTTRVDVVDRNNRTTAYEYSGNGSGTIASFSQNTLCDSVCTYPYEFTVSTTSRTPVTLRLDVTAH